MWRTMNSISLPNSQLLTPWPNSLLLHYPNHFPSSSSSSIFPSYTHTPPSSLATPSLSKRRRFNFSAGGGRLVVSALSGVGVTNSIPVSLLWFQRKKVVIGPRGNFIFIYLSHLNLERLLMDIVFYFYFYFYIIWFSLCLLYQYLNLNLPNMSENII